LLWEDKNFRAKYKKCKKGIDIVIMPCYYMAKLNRSDRGAGFISTLRQGQAAAAEERENRRSEENA